MHHLLEELTIQGMVIPWQNTMQERVASVGPNVFRKQCVALWVFFFTMPQLVRQSDIEAGNNLLVKEHHLPQCQEGNERFGNEWFADVL